jgi:DNA-binding LacI/PurR family transcriptional regulator
MKNDSILGIAYIVANLELKPEEVLTELTTLKKPVAVLDVVGGWNIPILSFANRFLQFFTVTTSLQPARQVAKYLLSHGHTRIAYISPFHKALWSKKRLQGVNQIYKDAGYPNGVVSLCLDRYAYQWDYLQHLEKQEDIHAFIEEYGKWKHYAHSKLFRKFGNISYSISKYLTQQNCASGEIYEKMTPLFKNALNDTGITAWLMANDYAGTLAIDYLKEQKVKIPEDVSVIAFDNTIDAMEYQLTSYDFNNNGIVNLMLRYILSPSSLPVEERSKVKEVDGMLVERLSVAHARK